MWSWSKVNWFGRRSRSNTSSASDEVDNTLLGCSNSGDMLPLHEQRKKLIPRSELKMEMRMWLNNVNNFFYVDVRDNGDKVKSASCYNVVKRSHSLSDVRKFDMKPCPCCGETIKSVRCMKRKDRFGPEHRHSLPGEICNAVRYKYLETGQTQDCQLNKISSYVKNDKIAAHFPRLDTGVPSSTFQEQINNFDKWFSVFNDRQKNFVLKRLLPLCGTPQLHLISSHMESAGLHSGCPSNCKDIVQWLPSELRRQVLLYLDPKSLCRASLVCKRWYELVSDPSIWSHYASLAPWGLSPSSEQKQIDMNTCKHTGVINWKKIFSERYNLRRNWLTGRCMVRTFEGHSQGISCLQFDETRIVSGSSDKTIRVWNIRTNSPWSVMTLTGHSATVRCLHLEGNRLVSGSMDKTIKVWDLSSQSGWSSIACRLTMQGHTDTVRCLQVDSDKVVSGSYDRTLKVWDMKTGECRLTLRGHEGGVLCLQFDEEKIVSGSTDRSIKVWGMTSGICLLTLSGHEDAVTCLQFDTNRIISGSVDCTLKFWNLSKGECLQTIDWANSEGHTRVVRCLQADSWRVLSAADDRTIKVWSLDSGRRLVTLHNHTDGVTCLQFNDYMIVSGSYDKTVKLWDFNI